MKSLDHKPLIALRPEHRYRVEYSHPNGDHWVDEFDNLVPDVGLNSILSIVYGSTAKAAGYFLGLVTGPGGSNSYVAGDSMSSHAGWTEAVPYSNGTRPAATFPSTATSKSISNSGNAAVFNINGNGTIAGVFLTDNNTKSGSTGTLMGVGNFSSGDKTVSSGGTLTVTVTATAA
jgi:hypothetical protein